MRNSKTDPVFELNRLFLKHARLKARVQDLDGRVFLTSEEQVERQRLKKEKLRTKDEIESMRNSVPS